MNLGWKVLLPIATGERARHSLLRGAQMIGSTLITVARSLGVTLKQIFRAR